MRFPQSFSGKTGFKQSHTKSRKRVKNKKGYAGGPDLRRGLDQVINEAGPRNEGLVLLMVWTVGSRCGMGMGLLS